jgi:hypothetical protein
MAVLLSPVGGVAGQFFDNNGDPLVGGKLFTYAAGTTTPQVTFTSALGLTPNSNPIILNGGGRVPSEIWLTDGLQYKFVLFSSTNQLIGSWDNIVGINSNFVNFVTSEEVQIATAGQTVFTLTTMQYQPSTNSLVVYVDGVNQVQGGSFSYVETNATTVTFTTGLHVGAVVKFVSAELLTGAATSSDLVSYQPAGVGAVATTVQTKLRETVSVKDFGAVGDGATDDTAALQNFFNAGGNLYLPEGTYLYSYLEFNTPFSLVGDGVLRYDGSAPPSGGNSILITAPVNIDKLKITSSGVGESAINYVRAESDNIQINLFEMKADVQRNTTGGSNFTGSNIFINQVISENVARPIAFPGSAVRTNVHIGGIYITNYIRGFAATLLENWTLDTIVAKQRWAGVSLMTPGHNGLLLTDCSNFNIGKVDISNAPEHSFRIAGSIGTKNYTIGSIYSRDSQGCAFKINPGGSTLAENGHVGSITGVNTGEGNTQANRELVRLTRVKQLTIGNISGYQVVTRALLIQDVWNLTVGNIYAENVLARLIDIRGDTDGAFEDVENIYVGNVTAYMNAGARAVFSFTLGFANRFIGNIEIANGFVTGFNTFVGVVSANNNYSGEIVVNVSTGPTDPFGAFENAVSTDPIYLTRRRGFNTYTGNQSAYQRRGIQTIGSNSISLGNVSNAQSASIYVQSFGGTAGLNALGGGFAFSRVTAARRGAAIYAKQTGNDAQNMGLGFAVGSGSTATDALVESMVLKHTGVVNLTLPTHADNAAALAAGLVAGDTYKTSAGELRIVV